LKSSSLGASAKGPLKLLSKLEWDPVFDYKKVRHRGAD